MTEAIDINTDLTTRTVVDTRVLDWEPGPNPTVWRKRLYCLAGEAEIETNIVRYEPGGHHETHTHPRGEEILVLAGTLSDEYGEFACGSYILNPPGTEHAPYSKEGCELFAMLGQYHGASRAALTVGCKSLRWLPGQVPDVSVKILYRQHGYAESMSIVKWEPGAASGVAVDGGAQEIFVLEGSFYDEFGEYEAGVWIRSPAGFLHMPGSRDGCKMYVRSLYGTGTGLRLSDPGSSHSLYSGARAG